MIVPCKGKGIGNIPWYIPLSPHIYPYTHIPYDSTIYIGISYFRVYSVYIHVHSYLAAYANCICIKFYMLHSYLCYFLWMSWLRKSWNNYNVGRCVQIQWKIQSSFFVCLCYHFCWEISKPNYFQKYPK